MKTTKSILVELVLPFILCWFFMTVLVDIVAIPTVFRNISNLQEGGKIGIVIFGRMNCFEIFFGTFILLGLFSAKEKSKLLIGLSISLLFLSFFYTFYMTPTMAQTSVLMHQVSNLDPQFEVLKKQHNAYHQIYRTLDTIKLLALLIFAVLAIRLNIKKIHKDFL